MLAKSKKNAVIMAVIFAIPMVVIALVVGQVRYAQMPPEQQNPNVVNGFAGVGPTLTALGVLLVSLGLLALIIYQLNESHYGRQGAVRWAIAGALYGALQQVVLTPIPGDFDFAAASILKQIGSDLVWKVATFALVYALVFPVFSAIQRRRLQRS